MFTPRTLSGLVLWLHADRGITTGATFTWRDQSGLGNDCAESTNQPTVNATGLNGRPLVQFDASNDVLSNATLSMAANTPFTVFVVGKSTNVNPDTTNRNGCWLKLGAPTARHTMQTSRVGGTSFVATTDQNTTITGTFGIAQAACYLMWSDDGNTGSANMGFRANGVAKTTSSGRPAALAVSGYSLNAANGGEVFGAGISEVLVCNRVLTADEIAKVESYLRREWGF